MGLGKRFGGGNCFKSSRLTVSVLARRLLLVIFLAVVHFGASSINAQVAPQKPPPGAPTDLPGQVVLNTSGRCVQPPPMVELKDYDGPFHKVIGTFTQKLERQSVRAPHYKQGAVLCSLQTKDKFFLFLRDAIDPETIIGSGFNAGISQAEDDDPSFGQGAKGYGERFGVSYIDQVQTRFFKEFAYPTIFSEDPRYYRMGQGSSKRRFLHAVAHSVVAYNDNGRPMFNFSEWMGEVSGTSIGNLYHPGNDRGVLPAAQNIAFDVAMDIGFDELREFWPEVARKLKLPFRDQNEPPPAVLPAAQ